MERIGGENPKCQQLEETSYHTRVHPGVILYTEHSHALAPDKKEITGEGSRTNSEHTRELEMTEKHLLLLRAEHGLHDSGDDQNANTPAPFTRYLYISVVRPFHRKMPRGGAALLKDKTIRRKRGTPHRQAFHTFIKYLISTEHCEQQ